MHTRTNNAIIAFSILKREFQISYKPVKVRNAYTHIVHAMENVTLMCGPQDRYSARFHLMLY